MRETKNLYYTTSTAMNAKLYFIISAWHKRIYCAYNSVQRATQLCKLRGWEETHLTILGAEVFFLNLAGMKTADFAQGLEAWNRNRFLPNAKPESRRRFASVHKSEALKQEEAPPHLPTRLCAEGMKRL
jgi:hypothetical protein